MEAPISFDILGKVDKSRKKEAVDWLMALLSLKKLDATKWVVEAVKEDGFIPLYIEKGWKELEELKSSCPQFALDVAVVETSYTPSEQLNFCEEHGVYHVAEQCPVCDGFYVVEYRNGIPVANKPSP